MKRLALVALLLLGAACDETRPSTDGPSVAAARVDPGRPCALLTANQVERALGARVVNVEEVEAHDLATRMCSYETPGPYTSVAVTVDKPVTRSEFEKRMTRDPPNTEILDDVADLAFIGGCSSLDMLVGDIVVEVSVQHLTGCEETGTVLRNLAREALTILRA